MITQVYSEHSHNFSYFVNVIFLEIFTKKYIFTKTDQKLQPKTGQKCWYEVPASILDFYLTVALGMI